MTENEQGPVRRVLATLATGSSAVLTGIPLAVPGVCLVWLLSPSLVGYYLIGFCAAATEATLRRLSDSPEVDLSDRTDSEIRTLFVILLTLATVSVSVRLLLGVVGAIVVQAALGTSGFSILAAATVPLVDRWLAESNSLVSLSGFVGSVLLGVIERIGGTAAGQQLSVGEDFEVPSGRFGPI